MAKRRKKKTTRKVKKCPDCGSTDPRFKYYRRWTRPFPSAAWSPDGHPLQWKMKLCKNPFHGVGGWAC